MDDVTQAKWYQEDRVDMAAPNEEPQTEKETQPVPPAEEKTDEKETPPSAEPAKDEQEKDENELPFHKHPRWKAMNDENRTLRERLDQVEQRVSNIPEPQQETEIPSWFQSVYGDDPALYSQYQQANIAERQAIKQEIINEIKAEQNSKSVEEQQINKYIEDQVSTLKDEGNQFDKNELMKVVLDNKLFDDEGRLNFRAGLAILKSTGSVSKTQQAKKDVAGKTDTTPKSPMKTDFVTSKDLQGRSWRDFTNN